jgi:ABC-type branched-subunit amino acid transport system substrate-binding protein
MDALEENPNFQTCGERSRTIPKSQKRPLGSPRWVFGILALGILTSCVPSTRPIVKIGLVAPFEGRYREIGEEIVYAVRLAVREANERGGVGGYSIELMAYDDRGDPAMAEEQAQKMATDPRVVGVLGHWLDSTTLAAAPVYAASDIPFLATTASPELDSSAFRLWYTESIYLTTAPDSVHCPLPCDSLENLDWLTSNLQSPISNLQASGPSLWGLNQFPRLVGDSAEGTYVLTPAPLPADSTDPTFADRYRAVSPGVEPRYLAVLAYDATNLLLEAIAQDLQSNKLPTRSGVESALAEIDYTGLSGEFSFDSERNWEEAKGWVYVWREGQLVEP